VNSLTKPDGPVGPVIDSPVGPVNDSPVGPVNDSPVGPVNDLPQSDEDESDEDGEVEDESESEQEEMFDENLRFLACLNNLSFIVGEGCLKRSSLLQHFFFPILRKGNNKILLILINLKL
jgi:hypothetical protein